MTCILSGYTHSAKSRSSVVKFAILDGALVDEARVKEEEVVVEDEYALAEAARW